MDQPQFDPPPHRQQRYEPLAVLQYIAAYRQQQGRSPSQRRIQSALQISAPSVVHNLLHRLACQGLLTITTHGRGRAGDLALTPKGQAALHT